MQSTNQRCNLLVVALVLRILAGFDVALGLGWIVQVLAHFDFDYHILGTGLMMMTMSGQALAHPFDCWTS